MVPRDTPRTATIHNNKLFTNSFKVILVIGNTQTLSE